LVMRRHEERGAREGLGTHPGFDERGNTAVV
jgi:hypothetical protein